MTLGLHCGTLGLQFATLGVHFGVFLVLLGTSGGHFGTLGLHLGVLLPPWGRALDPLGHFWAKGSKQVPKVTENGTKNGDIFTDILDFRGKWPNAFGSSRLDRIGV